MQRSFLNRGRILGSPFPRIVWILVTRHIEAGFIRKPRHVEYSRRVVKQVLKAWSKVARLMGQPSQRFSGRLLISGPDTPMSWPRAPRSADVFSSLRTKYLPKIFRLFLLCHAVWASNPVGSAKKHILLQGAADALAATCHLAWTRRMTRSWARHKISGSLQVEGS